MGNNPTNGKDSNMVKDLIYDKLHRDAQNIRADSNKLPADVSAQAPPGKKYLVVIRHGERFDELNPEVDIPVEEYYDTRLTGTGIKNSHSTGYHLAKTFEELGVLDNGKKPKFVTSLFYRCLQTIKALREGIVHYLEASYKDGSPAAELIELYQSRKTHIEDGCSEKIKGVPLRRIKELRIYKDKQTVLASFNSINPHFRSLFDYDGKHKDLGLEVEFEKGSHVLDACFRFYKKIIKRLHYDTTHDKYVVVAHGMYITTLLHYLDLRQMTMKKVRYNSCIIIEFDFHKPLKINGFPHFKVLVGNDIIHRPLDLKLPSARANNQPYKLNVIFED